MRALRRAWSTLTAGMTPAVSAILIVAMILAGAPHIKAAAPDLDSSWIVGITSAIVEGRSFGSEIVFAYGPWAFLDLHSALTFRHLLVDLTAWALTGIAFVLASWRVLRSWIAPLPSALIVALVVAPLLAIPSTQAGFSGRILMLTVLIGAGLATAVFPARFTLPAVIGLAALSAVAIETKFSNGVLALATVILVAALAPGRRLAGRIVAAGSALGTAALTMVLAWLAAGQTLADLPAWVRGSLELASGYAESMSTEDAGAIQYVAFAGLVALGVAVTAIRMRRGRVDLMLVLLFAWTAFISLRLGFTRHDDTHAGQAFLLLFIVLIGIATLRARILSAVAVAAAAALVLATWVPSYVALVDPAQVAQRALGNATALTSSSERATISAIGSAEIVEHFALPQDVQRTLVGETVHVDPFDTAIAWAYGFDWAPVPVFQTYSAFTPYLDGLNAAALSDVDGPSAVLRASHGTIDGRLALWESPQYALQLLCRFEPDLQTDDWQVLLRTEDRCGEPQDLGTVAFLAGESVQVPTPPSGEYAVVAEFHIEPSLVDRLLGMAFKPRTHLAISTDVGSFRQPLANVGGPLIVRMPDSAGWDDAFGGDLAFTSLSVPGSGSITFSAVRVAP